VVKSLLAAADIQALVREPRLGSVQDLEERQNAGVSPEPCAGAAGSEWTLPLRGLTEFTVLLWVYVVYSGMRNFVTGSPGRARQHATEILRVDRALGIDFGRPVRTLTHELPWLASPASLVYATHAIAPLIVLVLLYRKRPERYVRCRNTFVALLAVGLVGFWAYPVMPPYLLAGSYHFVDNARTLYVGHTPLPGVAVPNPNHLDVFGFSNPYAAMPSLHVGWALLTALAAWPLARRRWVKALLVAYPILMTAAVLATWNHFFLDAIAGGGAVLIAYGLASLLERLRATRPQGRPVLA
jgi:hypothetical protein